MLTNLACDIPDKAPTDSPLPRPYQLLRHVQSLLFEFVTRWNLIEVRATDRLQWFVNAGERDDELLVTLVNSHPSPSRGDARFRAAKVAWGENLMTCEKLSAGNAAEFIIEPNGVIVLRLRADQPIMTHDFGERPSGEQLDFISRPIFDALENGQREAVAMKIGYAPASG